MKHILLAAVTLTALSCGAALAAPAYIEKAVSDPARPPEDTKRDAQRLPAQMVEFAGIRPGMAVADLLPGTGYFTRIFARAVGPRGHVYAYFGPQYDARLKSQGQDPDNQFTDLKRTYPNLGTMHAPLGSFVAPEKLDVVWISDNYHDTHNKSYAADVAAMNKAVYAALKPGGVYVIVDHRAVKGAGPDATEKLHRMDEDIAKREIEAAGFKLVAESKLLTRPADDDNKRVFEEGEHDHTDQMMLKFRKPG